MPLNCRLAFLAPAVVLFAAGCGASIQAIYEGDVRFEHCMALDAQPTIRDAARRTCWVEWVAYFTYGQTRDRVLHAQLRIQQLDGAGGTALRVKSAPTDSTAPLPLPQLGKSRASLVDGERVETCEAECVAVHLDCMGSCEDTGKSPSCRPGCEAGLRSCNQQCRR